MGPLFQPSKSVKRASRKNKELSPVKSRSRSAMDNAAEFSHDSNSHDSVRPEELRVKDEQIKVLTEANMELATKLQLLEEAMVGADSVMERRSEMMRDHMVEVDFSDLFTGPGYQIPQTEMRATSLNQLDLVMKHVTRRLTGGEVWQVSRFENGQMVQKDLTEPAAV